MTSAHRLIDPTEAREAIGQYSNGQLIRDLVHLLTPYRGRFVAASLIRVVGDMAWLYPAYAFAAVVTYLTTYSPGASLTPFWRIMALWLVALFTRALAQFLAKFFGYQVAERVGIDANLSTLKHLFRLDMRWHERENTGNKIKRIQNAGEGLNKMLRIWFDNLIEIAVNLVAINIIISQFDRSVLLVLVFYLITYFFISSAITRRAGLSSYHVNVQEEKVNGLVYEAINNIKTVKVMSMAGTIVRLVLAQMDELFARLRVRIFWHQSRNMFAYFYSGGMRLAIVVMIALGIIDGRHGIGFLVMFSTYYTNLRESIDELSAVTQDLVIAKISVMRMKDILNTPITIDDDTGKVDVPQDWKTIRVQDVTFAYGRNPVLSHLTFDVARGEKVGIVGLSGAGKSTLFKLLLKEREEFTGSITLDDVPIQQIRKQSYFGAVSVVLQDTEVFNFSLKDNITITNSEKHNDHTLLKRALQIAHMDTVVKRLPQGLETMIGEKGIKLSGGERQRLGIARAIFKQPQLLLLDEATSHLDLESEEKIRDSLHTFFEHVTAIVIAHRLTTIREMDKILMIEDGQIIEQGSFNELMDQTGKFFSLWQKQRL
ncbi:ABC transporter ATP-binding protein [Candidatus Uhrbacteria bacterium]|nr:ABC transporter ATP-binding protein [Candidatus Uhrbacteria bacterium]